MTEIQSLKQQGLNVSQISAMVGISRPTVRKYLTARGAPRYGPRSAKPGILDPFKPYLEDRMKDGVWNGVVLLREIRERGYQGAYTVLRRYLQPLREAAATVATRRFETPPGKQAQVDWGHLGDLTYPEGQKDRLSGFAMTLGYSRALFGAVSCDEKLISFLRMHEAAFAYLGGIPEELLYDNCKTVVLGYDDRGEPRWHAGFLDFARYWGFVPRLCFPRRPQTKGKIESGIGYIRKNFLCGRSAESVADLDRQLGIWLAEVANVRRHGTTHEIVAEAWQRERPHLSSCQGRPPHLLLVEEQRKVARDAYIDYRANRYSVPWHAVGREVSVQVNQEGLQIFLAGVLLASHPLCQDRHQTITVSAHHADMPYQSAARGKNVLHLRASKPNVETRSLSVYEEFAEGARP